MPQVLFATQLAIACKKARNATKPPATLRYIRDESEIELNDYGLGEVRYMSVSEDSTSNDVISVEIFLPTDVIDYGAGPTEPQETDKLIVTIEGDEITLQPMSESGEPPFRYESRFQLQFRIHTKEINRE